MQMCKWDITESIRHWLTILKAGSLQVLESVYKCKCASDWECLYSLQYGVLLSIDIGWRIKFCWRTQQWQKQVHCTLGDRVYCLQYYSKFLSVYKCKCASDWECLYSLQYGVLLSIDIGWRIKFCWRTQQWQKQVHCTLGDRVYCLQYYSKFLSVYKCKCASDWECLYSLQYGVLLSIDIGWRIKFCWRTQQWQKQVHCTLGDRSLLPAILF